MTTHPVKHAVLDHAVTNDHLVKDSPGKVKAAQRDAKQFDQLSLPDESPRRQLPGPPSRDIRPRHRTRQWSREPAQIHPAIHLAKPQSIKGQPCPEPGQDLPGEH